MDSKFLKISKKIIAIMIVVMMCGTNISNAAFSNLKGRRSLMDNLKDALSNVFNFNFYDATDLQIDLEKWQNSGNYDFSQIQDMVGKLDDQDLKLDLEKVLGDFSLFSLDGILGGIDFSGIDLDLSSMLSSIDLSGLLDTLLGLIISGEELPVDAKTVTTSSVSAGAFSGDDYKVKLSAKVYENPNNKDGKWAVLIHPFLLNGELIAKVLGSFYYEAGYSIIAVDLRGFGDSEGSMAMGFLDSLDVYDWIRYIRDTYDAQQIMIHGVSIGGSTTNYISGIDKFIKGDEKVRIENATGEKIKSLSELGVIGLVDDCGYTNMLQFLDDKDQLIGMGIGLTDETFDYYSDATNSLKNCTLPVMIIHGTSDTTVDVSNGDTVNATLTAAGCDVVYHREEGRAHAAILMGTDRETYGEWVKEHRSKCEVKDSVINNGSTNNEKTDTTTTETENSNFLSNILNKFKGLFNF